jgi:hypothetical protein
VISEKFYTGAYVNIYTLYFVPVLGMKPRKNVSFVCPLMLMMTLLMSTKSRIRENMQSRIKLIRGSTTNHPNIPRGLLYTCMTFGHYSDDTISSCPSVGVGQLSTCSSHYSLVDSVRINRIFIHHVEFLKLASSIRKEMASLFLIKHYLATWQNGYRSILQFGVTIRMNHIGRPTAKVKGSTSLH